MVAYESLKTKEKSSWVIPKVVGVAYGSGRLRELFIKEFECQTGSYKGGRNWSWSLTRVVASRESTVVSG